MKRKFVVSNIIPSTQSPLMFFGYYLDSCCLLFSLAHFMDEIQFGCPQYHPFNPININAFWLPWFMSSFFLSPFYEWNAILLSPIFIPSIQSPLMFFFATLILYHIFRNQKKWAVHQPNVERPLVIELIALGIM
jgi:hypothetical protein